MAIFKRKENDLDDEEIIEKEIKDNKKFSKNLKDLKSVNKKKRKEPPKPWGKKERYIVLIVLAATVVIAAALSSKSQNRVSVNLKKPVFNFDFSSVNPFKEKVIILQKK